MLLYFILLIQQRNIYYLMFEQVAKNKLKVAESAAVGKKIDIVKNTLLQYDITSQGYLYVPSYKNLEAYLFMALFKGNTFQLTKKMKQNYDKVQPALKKQFQQNFSAKQPQQINVGCIAELFSNNKGIEQAIACQISKYLDASKIYSLLQNDYYRNTLRVSLFKQDKLESYISNNNKPAKFQFKDDIKNDIVIYKDNSPDTSFVILGFYNNIVQKITQSNKSQKKEQNKTQIKESSAKKQENETKKNKKEQLNAQKQAIKQEQVKEDEEEKGHMEDDAEDQAQIEANKKLQKRTFLVLFIILAILIFEIAYPKMPFYSNLIKTILIKKG